MAEHRRGTLIAASDHEATRIPLPPSLASPPPACSGAWRSHYEVKWALTEQAIYLFWPDRIAPQRTRRRRRKKWRSIWDADPRFD